MRVDLGRVGHAAFLPPACSFAQFSSTREIADAIRRCLRARSVGQDSTTEDAKESHDAWRERRRPKVRGK